MVPPEHQAGAGGGHAVARAQGGRLPRPHGRAHPRILRHHLPRREQGLIIAQLAPIRGIHLVRPHQGEGGLEVKESADFADLPYCDMRTKGRVLNLRGRT